MKADLGSLTRQRGHIQAQYHFACERGDAGERKRLADELREINERIRELKARA